MSATTPTMSETREAPLTERERGTPQREVEAIPAAETGAVAQPDVEAVVVDALVASEARAEAGARTQGGAQAGTDAGVGLDSLEGPDARRRELGAFLRSRRDRIAPEDVGLTPGRRRRTPGLRREEVAELAGVGVTWYTWLEQGRDIHASAEVVDALGRALRLNRHEREHLETLAGVGNGRHDDGDTLPRQIQTILDSVEPLPAFVSNARYDVLAWNRAEAALVGGLAHHAPADRNFLWLAFTDAGWRSLLVDWEDDVRLMLARFRSAMGRHVGEPAWSRLVRRLAAASPEFAELWERHEVQGSFTRSKRFRNPLVGPITLEYTAMRLAEVPECEVRIYTPADEPSRVALERLSAIDSALEV